MITHSYYQPPKLMFEKQSKDYLIVSFMCLLYMKVHLLYQHNYK